MSQYFFAIPALDPQAAQDEFNHFCATQRAVSVQREFVQDGANSFWALCVTVASGDGSLPDILKAPQRRFAQGKVDYKQVLSEIEFAQYARLRAWRKSVAERDGVPVYTVFTNEQLAEIVRRRVDSLTGVGAIDGIGPARLERYGAAVLAQLQIGPAATAGTE